MTSAISPHALDRVAALRAETESLLALARTLSEQEWHTPSAAQGWRVQEVVAHLSAACHGSFTPWLIGLMRSDDVEGSNDADADQRRSWPPHLVLAEYERWSPRFVRMQAATARLPGAGRLKIRLGQLGSYPVTLLASALTFDHWTHQAHDILPVLDRPAPATDDNRMAVVLEWMLAGLEQMSAASLSWLDRPVALTLDGPGGATWLVSPAGDGGLRVRPGGDPSVAARIAGRTEEFPAWGTRRRPWRDCDVKLHGDQELGTRFLDSLTIV
ncbi:MAG TPA: maleylpyruvate isomerase N-terminal domain-containing protein [Pseudonocardia sp.]